MNTVLDIVRELFLDFGVIFASVVITTVVVLVAVRLLSSRKSFDDIRILVIGLAVLGAVAGVAGGTSRVGVVGDIVPAAFVLVGGVSTYLFGVNRSKGIDASICAASFALALGLGYASGAASRGITERNDKYLTTCLSALSNPELLLDEKSFCRFMILLGEHCVAVVANDLTHLEETFGSEKFLGLYHQKYKKMASDSRDLINNTQGCPQLEHQWGAQQAIAPKQEAGAPIVPETK